MRERGLNREGGSLLEEMSGIPPFKELSYTEWETVISHAEDEHTAKWPISTEIFVVSEKERFRALVLSLPFEIDYTTIGSRRLHLWKY